ncbi:MAG: DUF4922 domain-containing protein [Prevotellaceae bacterium]|jgi:hypothetical protein|nr:DUF4922 domain-containing protein [Prevotellaceae bacterium]
MDTLNIKALSLLKSELETWTTARENFEHLKSIETKKLDFEGFSVEVHFNQLRRRSAAAQLDAKSIAERKCFLCAKNRPREQRSVDCGHFELLVNPYPIFPQHFTIASKFHEVQKIDGYFAHFTRFTQELSDFAVFFNAAGCGASAPDHLHFQAGTKNFLPLIKDYKNLKQKNAELVFSQNNYEIFLLKNYLRKVFCIETENAENALQAFDLLTVNFGIDKNKINIVSYFEDEQFYIFIFPRSAFRPQQFFADNEAEKLIISPGSVEMSGVLITPVKEHFNKITKSDVADIYRQVGAY